MVWPGRRRVAGVAMTAPDHSRLPLRDYDHLPLASLAQRIRCDPTATERTAPRSGASRLRSHRTAPPCWTSWPPSGEKAGRLKFNGRLPARSPLSNLEELEMLRLGVKGKARADLAALARR
jgi:hypothetical protein